MKAVAAINSAVGDTARLLSPLYSTQTLCAQFWYQMDGNLHLYLKTYSFGAFSSTNYFRFRGSNGDEWTLAQATINHPYAFQLVFEALINSVTSNGYILIDDVEVKFRACGQPASCNFEENFCGYTSLRNADFEWIILDGQFGINQNIWLVPQFDGTFGSQFGHFIYLDSLRNDGSKAKLQSELLIASSTLQCVQFYVYMKKNGGTLNVYRANKLTSQIETLYTENANLDSFWYEREFQLTVINQDATPDQDVAFTIIFEGIVQNSEGALAVDDIKIYNGNCTGTQVLPSVFDCKNGQVVNSTAVCDFKNDCSNGLDEKYCGTCDFEEYEYCGWYDDSIGKSYIWQRNRNGSLETNKPTNDHTFNNASGNI